jgi:branched-chain amino acid transport system permease protein
MKILNKKNIITLYLLLVVYGVVQVLFDNGIMDRFYMMTLILVCIYIILAISQNLITGFTGQLAIGHAGFMAIGAYMSALITVKMHGSLITGLIFGSLVAALAGVLIGIPTLRLGETTWRLPPWAWVRSSGLFFLIRITWVAQQVFRFLRPLTGLGLSG